MAKLDLDTQVESWSIDALVRNDSDGVIGFLRIPQGDDAAFLEHGENCILVYRFAQEQDIADIEPDGTSLDQFDADQIGTVVFDRDVEGDFWDGNMDDFVAKAIALFE